MQGRHHHRLFTPLRIGGVEVRNRLVMAPHSTHFADRIESERLAAYYAERAAGGVGLIVHEPVIVHPSSRSRIGKIHGYDPANVAAYRTTTDAVHAEGARIVCQLIHNGRQVDGHASAMPAWYPVEAARPGTGETTHRMSVEEIAEVVDGFATSARICVDGGFDGVELHAAHGYLLQAFLSPATNTRRDAYGGDERGRMRIVMETIAAVREAVGPEKVLGIRLSGDEFTAGGLDAAAGVRIATAVAGTGAVDYLSLVSGSLAADERIVPDQSFERGFNADLAAGVTAALAGSANRPAVLVTGRVVDPDDAARVLADGSADLVGMARSLIADPRWPERAVAGRSGSIRPCVGSNDCRDTIAGRRVLACAVNPDVGHEPRERVSGTPGERTVPPVAPVPLPAPGPVGRIVVIGGGPAGLECALTVARAGEVVTLLEREEHLGGQLRWAGLPPARAEYRNLLRHLTDRVLAAGVDVRCGVDAHPDPVTELDPRAVVVAAGARPADSHFRGPGVHTGWQLLAGTASPTRAVVVFDEEAGNGWPFWSVVEVLVDRGHRVCAVTPGRTPGTGVEGASVTPLLRRLSVAGVRLSTSTTVAERQGSRVLLRGPVGSDNLSVDGDLVVSPGRRSADELSAELRRRGVPTSVVGDALAPRRVATAIAEGRAAGRALTDTSTAAR